MIAEIIATGDEIRSGALVDSNSAHIAEHLEMAGIHVARHNTVGDDLPVLVALFQEVGARADLALVTGGLGPTVDDLSAAAAAAAAEVKLVEDPVAMAAIEAFFTQRQRPMNPSNRKQAWTRPGWPRPRALPTC
jgi:nicotinamide-nucleotide amidase